MVVLYILDLMSGRKKRVMDQQTYIIKFDGVSVADANRYADELRNVLLDATPDITVHRRRDDPHTQDFGATLILILGTPAVASVVTAVGNWLQLRNASLTFETPEKRVIIQNITSKNATMLAERLLFEK
jgi:hypothetical protein